MIRKNTAAVLRVRNAETFLGAKMSKPISYRSAIEWMVFNDDTEWVRDRSHMSVTASLVADIYGKRDEQVREDLQKALSDWKRALESK